MDGSTAPTGDKARNKDLIAATLAIKELEEKIAQYDSRINLLNMQLKVKAMQDKYDEEMGKISMYDAPHLGCSDNCSLRTPEAEIVDNGFAVQDEVDEVEDTVPMLHVNPKSLSPSVGNVAIYCESLHSGNDRLVDKALSIIASAPHTPIHGSLTSNADPCHRDLFISRTRLLWRCCEMLDGDWDVDSNGTLTTKAQPKHAQIHTLLSTMLPPELATLSSSLVGPAATDAEYDIHPAQCVTLWHASCTPCEHADATTAQPSACPPQGCMCEPKAALRSLLLDLLALAPAHAAAHVLDMIARASQQLNTSTPPSPSSSSSSSVPVPVPADLPASLPMRLLLAPPRMVPALLARLALVHELATALHTAHAQPDCMSVYVLGTRSALSLAEVRVADVDVAWRGFSPVLLACVRRSLPIAQLLAEHGADVHRHARGPTQDYGFTGLELAHSLATRQALLHAHSKHRLLIHALLARLGHAAELVLSFLYTDRARWVSPHALVQGARPLPLLKTPLLPRSSLPAHATVGPTAAVAFHTTRPNALFDAVYTHVPVGPHSPLCTRLLAPSVADVVHAYFSLRGTRTDAHATIACVSASCTAHMQLQEAYGPPLVVAAPLGEQAGLSGSAPCVSLQSACAAVDAVVETLYCKKRALQRRNRHWNHYLSASGEHVELELPEEKSAPDENREAQHASVADAEEQLPPPVPLTDEAVRALAGADGLVDLDTLDGDTLRAYAAYRQARMSAHMLAALFAPNPAKPVPATRAQAAHYAPAHILAHTRCICACGPTLSATEHASEAEAVRTHNPTCLCRERCVCRHVYPQHNLADAPAGDAPRIFLSPAGALALAHDLRALCAWTIAWQAKERGIRLFRRRSKDTAAHAPFPDTADATFACCHACANAPHPTLTLNAHPAALAAATAAALTADAAPALAPVASTDPANAASTTAALPLQATHVQRELLPCSSNEPANFAAGGLAWYANASATASTFAVARGASACVRCGAPGRPVVLLRAEAEVSERAWAPRDVDISVEDEAGSSGEAIGDDADGYGYDGKQDPMIVGAGVYYDTFEDPFHRERHRALHKRFQDVVTATIATALQRGVSAARAEVLPSEEALVLAVLASPLLADCSVTDVLSDLYVALDADGDGYISITEFEEQWNHFVQGNSQRRAEKGLTGLDWWQVWQRCRSTQRDASVECATQ